jgi:hypothetical protein
VWCRLVFDDSKIWSVTIKALFKLLFLELNYHYVYIVSH